MRVNCLYRYLLWAGLLVGAAAGVGSTAGAVAPGSQGTPAPLPSASAAVSPQLYAPSHPTSAIAVSADPTSTPAIGPRQLTLVADDWCPYNCSADAPDPGYVLELAQLIFASHGVQVVYLRQPWARALQAVQRGEATAAIGATAAEVPEARFPQEPIGWFEPTLIQRRDAAWHYQGTASLQGKRLAVIDGYDYGPFNTYIDSQRQSPDLLVLHGDDAARRALAMLGRGRLDGYVEDRNVAGYTARALGLQQSLRLDAAISPRWPLYLAFSAQDPASDDYTRWWSEGVQTLRADGRLAQILDRYGVVDWGAGAVAKP